VGGFGVEYCVIHSLFESKTVWNQNLFEKDCFIKKWFEKGLKLFDLVDFADKPIQSIVSRIFCYVCKSALNVF